MILNSSQLNKAKEESSFDNHHDEFFGLSILGSPHTPATVLIFLACLG